MPWNTYTAQGQQKVLQAASPLAPMIPISDTVLGASQASITVNVPSTYQHLQVVVTGRQDTGAVTTLQMRFNGDTAANYYNQTLTVASTVVTGTEGLAVSLGARVGRITGTASPAGSFSNTVIDIPSYTSTTAQKGYTARCSSREGTTTGTMQWEYNSGQWISTAAITSVTIYPATGNFVAGTQVTVYGLGVTTPNAIGVGAFTPPTYGTTLPASPADGQQAILVDSTTSPTYQWLFRYNNGSSNTDKWEFVGGTSPGATVATSETTASVSYVDLATAGPSVTVPRAGVYEVRFGNDVQNGTASQDNFSTIKIGAAAGSDSNSLRGLANGTGGSNVFHTSRTRILTGVAASDVLKMQYRVSGGTGAFVNRWLTVTPVRVS